MSDYISDIKSNITIPDDLPSRSKEEVEKWSRSQVQVAIDEIKELNYFLNKMPYRTNNVNSSIFLLEHNLQQFVDKQHSRQSCFDYKFSFERNGHIIMRDMCWYYCSNAIPVEEIYPKLIPACINNQVWKEQTALKEKRKKAAQQKTYFNSRTYDLPLNPDHKYRITIDANGNKHYPQRPMKYQSLDGLWILIPICLFLCLTGWGGVIFSIFAIIAFFAYQDKHTQELWERDCDFYSHFKSPYSDNHPKDPIKIPKDDNKQ